MKEIKFRAFVKDENRVINEITFHKFEDINTQFEDDELVFMQYTGLTDKNGVEIYESDLLSYDAPKFSKRQSPNPKVVGTEKALIRVESVRSGFIGIRECFWSYQYPSDFGEELANMQNKTWVEENCEVIGNIYEDEELLR